MVISGQTTDNHESATTIVRRSSQRLRFLQTFGLFRGQHSKCSAHLHAHPSDLPDHGQNPLKSALPSREVSPSGTHAESRASIFFGLTGGLEDGLDIDERGRLGCGRIPRGLRTVRA